MTSVNILTSVLSNIAYISQKQTVTPWYPDRICTIYITYAYTRFVVAVPIDDTNIQQCLNDITSLQVIRSSTSVTKVRFYL